jgi:hypothetical protein
VGFAQGILLIDLPAMAATTIDIRSVAAERVSPLPQATIMFTIQPLNTALYAILNLNGGSAMGIDELLKDRREDILRIAAQHGAHNVRVFGSVARGDARPDSDVDLLVELEAGRSSPVSSRPVAAPPPSPPAAAHDAQLLRDDNPRIPA